MGGNNMPLHAPAEFPAWLGRGMSACLEVWFEKNRRARAPAGAPRPPPLSRSPQERSKQLCAERRRHVGTGGVRERGEEDRGKIGQGDKGGTRQRKGAGRDKDRETRQSRERSWVEGKGGKQD